MNKEKQLNRMKDMIDYNLSTLKEVIEDNELDFTKENLINELIEIENRYVLIELTVILYTIKEITNISLEEINEYLTKEINMTYDDLREIEDQLLY